MTEAGFPRDGDGLFGTVIAAAVDGILVIDERGLILVYNKACERLFGFTRGAALGRDLAMLMPAPYAAEHASYVARYLFEGKKRIIGIGREIVGRRKDGSVFPMYISVGEGLIGDKRIFVGVVHDVSARKARQRHIDELQRKLRHATRLSVMEQLTDALAHELNQPLTAALNYANTALHMLQGADDEAAARARAMIEKLTEQTVRVGETIRNLRAFPEKREDARLPIDINEAVGDAIALGIAGIMRQPLSLETVLAEGLPRVAADGAQIGQVLINLLLNALDAVRGTPEPRLRVVTSADGDGGVRVAVVDNGSGLSDDARHNLFRPFVTTKPSGAGMGLSICRAIIEAHGGRLWAEESPEGGMIFQFTLPPVQDAERID